MSRDRSGDENDDEEGGSRGRQSPSPSRRSRNEDEDGGSGGGGGSEKEDLGANEENNAGVDDDLSNQAGDNIVNTDYQSNEEEE